jgi:uncharacterized protein (DUF1697 family)
MRYVALLRGIAPMNPNMRNAKLRGVFEQLGFENVRTVISSGNVVFDAPRTRREDLEARIEGAWPELLGFTSTTIIRSRPEIERLLEDRPFGERSHSSTNSLNVTFLKTPERRRLIAPPGVRYELVGQRSREVFTAFDPNDVKAVKALAWLERELGKRITTRTLRTVERIRTRMRE